jgi:hypothetical protein
MRQMADRSADRPTRRAFSVAQFDPSIEMKCFLFQQLVARKIRQLTTN